MPADPTPESASEALARDLYENHGPALQRWARQRFADNQVAEEVAHEAIMNGWRKHHQFDPSRGSERAWMFGILRNVAASRHRADARRLRVVPTEHVGVDPSEDGSLERIAQLSLVADAFAALSEDHRAVLVAAYWDGLTTKEIAADLSIPDGTVKSRLHYALRILRTQLEEQEVL